MSDNQNSNSQTNNEIPKNKFTDKTLCGFCGCRVFVCKLCKNLQTCVNYNYKLTGDYDNQILQTRTKD